jgi:hypothetical protein
LHSMPRHSALAGQISPILDRIILSREDFHSIVQHVSSILSMVDLLVLFIFGWLLVPYTRIIYPFLRFGIKSNKDCGSEKKDDVDDVVDNKKFETSILYFVVDHLSQVARLAVLVYACDCVVIALEAVDIHVEYASNVFAKILYTT